MPAAGTGLCALLVAVALFLSCGEKEYAFLEKEPLEVPPERSWVIWTAAGVGWGAVMRVMRLLNLKKYPPTGLYPKGPEVCHLGAFVCFPTAPLYFLKLSFRETLRLNTRCSAVQSRLSMQK